jgi:hypothetical protein
MENALIKLRTAIFPSLMQKSVRRATFLAIGGAVILLYGTLFMSVEQLQSWGLPMLCIASLLIACGMQPYRRLRQLERTPDELLLLPNQTLYFISGRKPIFTLPCVSIQQIAYREFKNRYGVAILLKTPLPEKILVHNPGMNMERFMKNSQHNEQCDIFLPYFSERSFDTLLEHLRTETEILLV